ncbi:uncharacterized protein LOC144112708 [Amblyomma americanum]
MPSTKWYSQPTQRRIGHDNVLLAAAILFTRCSPTEPLRLVENAGICSFSKCTYDRIQKDILFPAPYTGPHLVVVRGEKMPCVISYDTVTPLNYIKFAHIDNTMLPSSAALSLLFPLFLNKTSLCPLSPSRKTAGTTLSPEGEALWWHVSAMRCEVKN